MQGYFNTDKMFTYLKGFAMGKDMPETLKALNYARKLHKGQNRKGGEPYIIHPLNVACILAELHVGPATICAGLLHDVIEDTEVSKEELGREKFKERIDQWYKDYKVKNGVLVDGYSEDYGYHALVVYGYNEQGFLVQNSWGKNWGNKGRFILPYDIKIAEARSLIDINNDDYIIPNKPNKFMEFLYKLLNNIVNFIRQLQTN